MKSDIVDNDKILKCIKGVIEKQKIGVLATSGDEGPYQSLVAFTVLPAFHDIVFATEKNTTKYRNIKKMQKVSLLIDNRTEELDAFKNLIIITVVGEAFEVEGVFEEGPGKEYMNCHPLLGEKFLTKSSALINIKVKKYIVVSSLDEVREFYP